MSKPIRRFKLAGVPKNFDQLAFGQQVDYLRKIQQFKTQPETRSIHLSQKRKSYTKAIREAIDLYCVGEFYCQFNASSDCFDDSFEFFYTTK